MKLVEFLNLILTIIFIISAVLTFFKIAPVKNTLGPMTVALSGLMFIQAFESYRGSKLRLTFISLFAGVIAIISTLIIFFS
ncbi:hypothetical protein YDYSY3_07290 [Paenibacillus chitinolyticus]|uniref:hypothetical protein n=1 Tax=Paenibacillus chitinolyticus TaxID=79263 RepID=UPI0026E4FD00|nr:hypothetical protein [Paenibacillus chitinolyticus]GKS09729.1 hypothetical protein YDYSY3_07290 [Paenibacillus chitinolyticus]